MTDNTKIVVLKKPSSTLGVTPTHGNLSVTARRAFTAMMILAKSQLNKEENRQVFSATLQQITSGIDAKKNSASTIKQYILEMLTTVVEWEAPSESDNLMWAACTLVSEVQMVRKNGEVIINWSYAPTLREELANPSRYAQINETSLMDLKIGASYPLYEICARYKDNPSHLSAKKPWQWWYLKLAGKPKNTEVSTEYKFFKRDTLSQAIKVVNKLSEITIELIEIRVGKKVVDLQFKVERKQTALPIQTDEKAFDSAIKLGLSKKEIRELTAEFGEDKFAIGLQKLKDRNQRAEEVNYPAAWIRRVLQVEETQTVAHETHTPVEQSPIPAAVIDRKAEAFAEFFKAVQAEFESLNADTQSNIVKDYIVQLESTKGSLLQLAKLKENDWTHPIVKNGVLKYFWVTVSRREWVSI